MAMKRKNEESAIAPGGRDSRFPSPCRPQALLASTATSPAFLLLAIALFPGGCEIGGATGGPGVEPPVLGPGGDDYASLMETDEPAIQPGGVGPDAQVNVLPDAGPDVEGQGDAGSIDRESCPQAGESFREDFAAIAAEHANCETAEQCTVIRARMECPAGGVRLDTCAHAVATDELTALESELGTLAATTYCTGGFDGCADEPECAWPREEADCVDGRCEPIFP
jgi:hypothetical protein